MLHYFRITCFALLATFLMASCTKEQTQTPLSGSTATAAMTTTATATKQSDTSSVAATGRKYGSSVAGFTGKSLYRISYFFDNNRNRTSQYTNYVFTFNTTGGITAKKKPSGWLYYGSYFFDNRIEEIDIDFDTETILDDLRGDWDINEFSDQAINLVDGHDRLIFTKI